MGDVPTVSKDDFANAELRRVAYAIWNARPDCERKPWPIVSRADERQYPHQPIAALDLCFAYAKVAIAAMRSPSDAEGVSREDGQSSSLPGNPAEGSDIETDGALGPVSPQLTFSHKSGCPVLTAAGNPECTCGGRWAKPLFLEALRASSAISPSPLPTGE